MKIVKNDEKETPKSSVSKYDASKGYAWTPTDVFSLTGEQFGLILNALRGILNTPEAAKILMANKANEAIESIMADAVNRGIVKETNN